jgi:hypothetical protein
VPPSIGTDAGALADGSALAMPGFGAAARREYAICRPASASANAIWSLRTCAVALVFDVE